MNKELCSSIDADQVSSVATLPSLVVGFLHFSQLKLLGFFFPLISSAQELNGNIHTYTNLKH